MPPSLKTLVGHIDFGLCVRACVTLFYASYNFRTVHARVLKFYIWIPRGKIADRVFYFLSYALLWNYAAFKNEMGIFLARYLKYLSYGLDIWCTDWG